MGASPAKESLPLTQGDLTQGGGSVGTRVVGVEGAALGGAAPGDGPDSGGVGAGLVGERPGDPLPGGPEGGRGLDSGGGVGAGLVGERPETLAVGGPEVEVARCESEALSEELACPMLIVGKLLQVGHAGLPNLSPCLNFYPVAPGTCAAARLKLCLLITHRPIHPPPAAAPGPQAPSRGPDHRRCYRVPVH